MTEVLKFTLYQALKTQKGSRRVALRFFNLAARWGCAVNDTPWPIYSRERPDTQWYRLLGGPQDRSRPVRKISFPPGFDLRTVKPLASRYTD